MPSLVSTGRKNTPPPQLHNPSEQPTNSVQYANKSTRNITIRSLGWRKAARLLTRCARLSAHHYVATELQ